MELILWRHAEAEDGTPDLERRLTEKGRKQADRMTAFLHRRLPPNTRILVSPAARTQQTAQALAGDRYETVPAIAPGTAPEAILEAAGWPDGNGCVVIVGHQPTLGETAARLLGQPAACSIKKGAVWWFSRRERNGEQQTNLRLVISPDFL